MHVLFDALIPVLEPPLPGIEGAKIGTVASKLALGALKQALGALKQALGNRDAKTGIEWANKHATTGAKTGTGAPK